MCICIMHPTHTHTLSLSLSLTHTHTHTHTHTKHLALTRTSVLRIHSCILSFTHTLTGSFTHTHTFSPSLFLSISVHRCFHVRLFLCVSQTQKCLHTVRAWAGSSSARRCDMTPCRMRSCKQLTSALEGGCEQLEHVRY